MGDLNDLHGDQCWGHVLEGYVAQAQECTYQGGLSSERPQESKYIYNYFKFVSCTSPLLPTESISFSPLFF